MASRLLGFDGTADLREGQETFGIGAEGLHQRVEIKLLGLDAIVRRLLEVVLEDLDATFGCGGECRCHHRA